MKILTKIILSILILGLILLGLCYGTFLYVLPNIVNSQSVQCKYQEILKEKVGISLLLQDFYVKTYPNLSFDIKAKSIFALDNDNNKLVDIRNIKYNSNILNLKNSELNADKIFVDASKFKKDSSKKPIKKEFNLTYYPKTNIKEVSVYINKSIQIEAKNILSSKVDNQVETTLLVQIYTPYMKTPIVIGQEGKIIYNKNISLDGVSVQVENAKFLVSGDKDKISFKGKSVPVRELEKNFLNFYKKTHPNKRNFLENFDNFSGTLDVNLDYSKSGFNGECKANNLSADFWTRKINVTLPSAVFYFKDREVKAQTSGTFGYEPVTTDFYLNGIATKNLHIEGNIYSKFTNKIVKRYFPEAAVQGVTVPKVRYVLNNQAVDVYYDLKIPKGNNILSDYGNLDNVDKNRQVTLHTYKNGETIYLKNYEYLIDNNKIIYGDGVFEKENGKYKLSKISAKTNGQIKIAVIKSFLRNYINDGAFDADVKYDLKTDIASGMVNLYDIKHSGFLYLKKTSIGVEKNVLKMNSQGSFYNSPISISLEADNNFDSGFLIHNIDIYLKRFELHKGRLDLGAQNSDSNKKNFQTTDFNIEVKKGQLIVDELYHDQFTVENIKVLGSLNKNIVNFVIPRADYSKGIVSAKGTYDVKNHDSDIRAYASDIDSNAAATRFFKLKDQIEGTAYATAHLITKNRLNKIKADVNFAVDKGFLPKLGSREFIISRTEKNKQEKIVFTLSKITNIDFSKPVKLYSNLYGFFALDNNNVKNVKIFAQNDIVGLFIEGDYNIDSGYGDLTMWGRHNKTAIKKIRILKIPINWIYNIIFSPEYAIGQYKNKIDQIPEIKADKHDTVSTFRVHVSGQLNSDNKVKVELKDLR